MSAGVYKITCVPTGKVYVGSAARSFARRKARHWLDLRKGTHHNFVLQQVWDKYGEDAFRFEPLIVCRAEDAIMYEQAAIDALRPELNVTKTAGSLLGYRHTPEVKGKIGRPATKERRLLISASRPSERKVKDRAHEWGPDARNGRRKLTEAQVLEVRRRWDERSATMREMARELGTDHHTISNICHRVTWRNL